MNRRSLSGRMPSADASATLPVCCALISVCESTSRSLGVAAAPPNFSANSIVSDASKSAWSLMMKDQSSSFSRLSEKCGGSGIAFSNRSTTENNPGSVVRSKGALAADRGSMRGV